jgi:hypothetical protein
VTDDKNYTVTGPNGYRRGSLTREQAEQSATSMNEMMKRRGWRGKARIWYRDGTEVAIAATSQAGGATPKPTPTPTHN